MSTQSSKRNSNDTHAVTGGFVDAFGERYYAIRNVDRMPPFFVSVVSDSNHWLFASSNGGLTAGRVSPETALFPYVTVDKIHDSSPRTGCFTLMRVRRDAGVAEWWPFDPFRHPEAPIRRTLYKNVLGNKLCFEERHLELGLTFRYRWLFSDEYGFVRECTLSNDGDAAASVELLDGFRNVLPAGTPRFAQTNTSNLVDAYKWSELDTDTGLASFTLYSAITDRAEPMESLRANTVFSVGLDAPTLLLGDGQIDRFRSGLDVDAAHHTRGQRGCYLARSTLQLAPGETRRWYFVVDVEQDQAAVVALRQELRKPGDIEASLHASIERGSDAIAHLMASADALQATGEEAVSVHHYANVLFNVLRGGIFDNHYQVRSRDFARTLRIFDRGLAKRHAEWLSGLPETLAISELVASVVTQDDPQLERLCREYLPIRFGRRHGDPSRPWNQFAIELKDEHGKRILAYQGNWRDIFQNWEALSLSYPDFLESMIAKFVNASTVDGYNPYRITSEGIDWEVEEPDDPWSYIGYWGDHQIIYLQKLLELSQRFHPERLHALLHRPVYCYANVPYRIKPFDALLRDPKNTVEYDEALAARIDERVAARGADGKLLLDGDGQVRCVTLFEKLLVPLLAKLGNYVPDAGIWLNTQRPEWNDANNALVGYGASMVTLYYMRRYVTFAQELLGGDDDIGLSAEVADWLGDTAAALADARSHLDGTPVTPEQRFGVLDALGRAADRYRNRVYARDGFTGTTRVAAEAIRGLLSDALHAIDHSIATNRRADGMYHAYNIIAIRGERVDVDSLYLMLEGQVAALSAGSVAARDAAALLDALFDSEIFRADQHSFLLYPDRALPSFLERNRIDEDSGVTGIPLVADMLAAGDARLVVRDADGAYRFHADLTNAGALDARLDLLEEDYPDAVGDSRQPLHDIYEAVFEHRAFTGRSGTMFAFEGLGSIYWHMVSKLLLAVQENVLRAIDDGEPGDLVQRLATHYYRVRDGIGFNKTPGEYGAFPTDPYSHTPAHAGAQQPGMTGQVKEEILTRFGELGISVHDGQVRFRPALLRRREFAAAPATFRYVAVDDRWRALERPADALAFTWCQVPIVYRLSDSGAAGVDVVGNDGATDHVDGLELTREQTAAICQRSGAIAQLTVTLTPDHLLDGRSRTG